MYEYLQWNRTNLFPVLPVMQLSEQNSEKCAHSEKIALLCMLACASANESGTTYI